MNAWLAFAYAALALGLGWVLAGDLAWRWRVPYIVAGPLVALALWLGRPDPAGWPTSMHVPAHASLQWALVDEPDPATADPGRIYLWLDVGRPSPRAFSLPYTRRLHTQVQHALRDVQHGRPVAVAPGSASGPRVNARKDAGTLRFYPHPPTALPPKTGGR
jgi:hypothetical protein